MKKILVADDEGLVLFALSRTLKCAQTEVKAVRTGKDALREIKGCFFDLCILDINLPDMLGLDIMKIVKETAPATKIIMITASELDNDTIKLIRDNECSFLSKPFDLVQIKSFVNELLGEGLFIDQSISNRRQHERKAMRKPTVYSVTRPGENTCGDSLKAEIIDISFAGMGITTSCPLAPGCVLRFDNGFSHITGVVRWNRAVETADMYRVGIQFI
jgi:CheY-like chemotaxis protein